MSESSRQSKEYPLLSQKALEQNQVRCSTCSVGDLCVALGADQTTLEQLDDLLQIEHPMSQTSHVVRQGDDFTGLYAVREGCFKSYITDKDGREQVQGFHFPGELFGIEGISLGKYSANVVALQSGGVCALQYSELLKVSSCSSALQQQLLKLFSGRLATNNWLGGDYSASERVAAFLLDVSDRLQERKLDGVNFEMPMSRSDIANYLGLATETVSRVFTRFNKDSIISVRRKRVTLLEPARLQSLAESVIENRGR